MIGGHQDQGFECDAIAKITQLTRKNCMSDITAKIYKV
jgi:hypothetical protein